jgi:hypothetical protein
MQNLKQMEEYKKEKMSKSAPEQDPVDDDSLDMDDMEGGEEEMGMDMEVEDQPTFSQEVPGQIEIEAGEAKPYMVLANLKKICDQANQLIGMVQSSGKAEQWAVDHITTSADDIEEVYNYYKYRV